MLSYVVRENWTNRILQSRAPAHTKGLPMEIGTLAFLAAFFHAVAAAVQQVLRKRVLDVASTYQVGAGIFSTAAMYLLAVHILSSGGIWFNGSIEPMFWVVMIIFIAANAVATILSLQVLQGETLVGAMTALLIAAGLLSLGDVVFFQNVPTFWQVLGIVFLIVAFGLFWQGKAAKKEKVQGVLLKAIIAIAIYNFVTPVTNKYCAIVTTATFSAWIAHAGIALVLLSAHALQVREHKASWGISAGGMSNKAFLIGLAVMGSLTAMSNGLLSWSFELGGSIPAALMMKRALPPIMVFLWMVVNDHRAGRQINWKQAAGIAAATGGTTMLGIH